jgi:hypothetical protein
VHQGRMAANALAAADELLAEGRALAGPGDEERLSEPADYLGASGLFVDAVLQRAGGSSGGSA